LLYTLYVLLSNMSTPKCNLFWINLAKKIGTTLSAYPKTVAPGANRKMPGFCIRCDELDTSNSI